MRALTLAGRTLTIAGDAVSLPAWSDLAPWAHSWDAADSTVLDGRAVRVADRAGGLPLRPFPDGFPLLGADPDVYGLLPAPLWLPESPRFNGRPALACDPMGVGPPEGALFNLHAGLTPNVSPDGTESIGAHPDDSAVYFDPPDGYAHPYWVAVLGRIGNADDPANDPDVTGGGVWDATHGGAGTGPTIGSRLFGIGTPNWAVSNFGPSPVQVVVAHPATKHETVLVLVHVNGAASFLEVTWRSAAGELTTLRATGEQRPWRYLECFVGWVHGQYLSAAGIGLGVPAEPDLDRVRAWAAYWLPPAGPMADEMGAP